MKEHSRLLSLDVFRGMTIAGMILVNCPGNDDTYPFLAHAAWNGLTFADLIFPAFLVIMGLSMTLSLGRSVDRGENSMDILSQALRRSTIIFSLGLIQSLVMMPQLGLFRIPGVLQRIALCNLACAILFLKTKPGTQVFWALALLAGYYAAMIWIPTPGRGAGDLSPDGNLASYVDRMAFGEHLWAKTRDPEGLLSTLPAIATSLLGVLAGHRLRLKTRSGKQALDILLLGAAAGAGGLLWSPWFPLNKNLWTSSFALLSGGIALTALAACHWLIETLELRAWGRPFEIFGRNALASYFLSELFYGLQEFIHLPGRDENIKERLCRAAFGNLSRPNAALAYALAYLFICLFVMRQFHRKKIYVKV